MALKQIPEKLINFRAYGGPGALEFLGATDCELPDFESMTETISGAGIAGEYDSPVLGHLKQQILKLKLRVPTAFAMSLLAPVFQSVQVRGAIQILDPMNQNLTVQQIVLLASGETKSFKPGKVEPGKPMGCEIDLECSKLTLSIDGVEIVSLDKFNMVYRVLGVDYLQAVRLAVGG